jgi:hypothetical protein
MGASEWAWTYGRVEALRGARSTHARCGPRICAALLEEEAGRRLARRRVAEEGGSAARTADDGTHDEPKPARLAALLERIGEEMRTICALLAVQSPTHDARTAPPSADVASTEWCDLRALRTADDDERRRTARAAMRETAVGEEVPAEETAAALVAKFELWKQLAIAIAMHRAALAS